MRRLTALVLISATTFNIATFALGAATLAEYLNQRSYLLGLVPKAEIHDNAYIGAASYSICSSFLSALILLIVLIIQVLRRTIAYRVLIVCAVVPSLIGFTNAITLTIITATKVVSFGDSVGPRVTTYLDDAADSDGVPLEYRKDAVSIAAVVITWVGWAFSVVGCALLLKAGQRKAVEQTSSAYQEEKAAWSEDGSEHGRV
ncbi:hypothetical protein ASPACDRAFT_47511 [Aspergillus aculeatus ATCC 16872]|uniref:MARVEL domain-containing protein n=1 Tax=Aspergillus aculeatus (strain ATCC 16872 / CBS 172.66 / WB 5094) TaxID=690307 RepID=A0A1L9WHG5_ASPA1|nr:uncharacterized protein ASPACDRAFT_47511 [Aspergillus aculeatus ATCC 16872]OJJ95621.1 hypothetical protein ASPACDRAFT_47511 [Aspergillus aculeatus ATCC 16872]